MKSLLLIILMVVPFKQFESVKLSFPSQQHEIFKDYSNDNFSQELEYENGEITAEIKCMNFFELDLNFRIVPDRKLIKTLDKNTKNLAISLINSSSSFKSYMMNISSYLKQNITYSEMNLPQDYISVTLNKKANCVGYSNLLHIFLKSAGIKNKILKGFYLKNSENKTMTPIPHRWIEIYLPNKMKFFYDPQYQKFSANYIVVRDSVDFKRVKRFKIKLIKKSKKIVI